MGGACQKGLPHAGGRSKDISTTALQQHTGVDLRLRQLSPEGGLGSSEHD